MLNKAALRILFLCAAVYVFVFFTWCYLKYHGFSYGDFDLAVHDQMIWNILHGRIFNSILGIDFLGNHAHFISFLIAPFYWFFPHPLFLLFLQTAFLAAGAFPLYGLARLYLDIPMSLTVGIIYLLYPGLGFINLYEFHPTCFAVFFLLCTAYFFYREKFFLFNLFMGLSLLCQENMALIFLMWGIYALFLRRKLKWVLGPSCMGLAYFLFCVYIVLPAFNKNTFDFFYIYGHLGNSLGQVIRTCFLHPVQVAALMFAPHKIYYLTQLFISVSFVCFLSPLSLLPAFLIFLQHLLSARPSEVDLHYHYSAELIPFIFVSFIFGIKKLTGHQHARYRYLWLVLLINAFIVNMALGPHFGFIKKSIPLFWDNKIVQKEALIEQIPQDAAVVTTFAFLSHLSHRQYLYSFHYVYSGFYTFSTKPFYLPDNVQYALIDFNDPLTFGGFYGPDRYRNIDHFLENGPWGVMDVRDNIVLFKKGIKNRYPLFSFINGRMPVVRPAHWTVDHRIELYGYDVHVQSDRMDLVFYWKPLRPEPQDIHMSIDFIDAHGDTVHRAYRSLCYGIWPTQAWHKGQLIEEHQYFTVLPQLQRCFKKLKFGFYDYWTGRGVPLDST